MIHIYSIPYPSAADLDAEEFSGLFAAIDMEGMEEKEKELCIYLDDAQQNEGESLITEICSSFKISWQKKPLENKNWNEQWESSFQPILIDDFVLVRATFHPENKNVEHEIIIEPKMSFGTGHHPTTAQMMQCMRLLDWKDQRVLDCGSGTGILCILAEKLGAKNGIALDNDTWCYQNCIENLDLNNCEHIRPELGSLENVKEYSFDRILANIHRNFLVEHMAALSSLLKDRGYLLVSGFYTQDAKAILDAALEQQLIATYRMAHENWEVIVLQKNKK